MSSKILFALFAVAALLQSASVASAQAFTTRIEPRPFYGATVTLEEGVRVIRPLPPERQVIINPGNATPLALGFNETRVYENRTVRNYNYSEGGSAGGYSGGRFGYRGGAAFYGSGLNFPHNDRGNYGNHGDHGRTGFGAGGGVGHQ